MQTVRGDPAQKAGRIAEIGRIDSVLARDIDADDGAAMEILQHIDREVAQHCAIDKQAMIAAVRERGLEPADDNEADAIAILLWALETNGGLA